MKKLKGKKRMDIKRNYILLMYKRSTFLPMLSPSLSLLGGFVPMVLLTTFGLTIIKSNNCILNMCGLEGFASHQIKTIKTDTVRLKGFFIRKSNN
jgi:hypothetical protein